MASLKNILQDKNGKVGIGTYSPSGKLHIYTSSSGATPYESDGLVIEKSSRPSINLLSTATSDAYIFFGQPANGNRGYLGYVFSSDRMEYRSTGTHLFYGGNVGIGTTSPSAKLDVNGEFSFLGGVNGYWLKGVQGNSAPGGNSPFLALVNNNTISSATYGWLFYDSNSDGSFNLYCRNNSTTSSQVLTISRSTGNVGIGTTSPDSKLTVSSSGSALFRMIRNQNFFGFEATDTSSGGYGLFDYQTQSYDIFFKAGNVGIGTTSPSEKLTIFGTSGSPATSGTGTNGIFAIEASNGNSLYFGSYVASPYGFWLQAANYVAQELVYPIILNPNGGNVGIGTTSPTEKLQVNGNIYTTNNVFLGASGNYSKLLFYRYEGSAVGGMGWHTDNKFYVGGFPDWGQNAGNDVRIYGFGALLSLGSATAGDVLNITTSGNVGIGAVSPNYKLDVVDQVRITNDATITPSGNLSNGALFISNNGSSSSYSALQVKTSGGLGLAVQNNGNVGIGTTSPAGKLSIEGDGTEYSNIVFKQSGAQEHLLYALTNIQYNLIGSGSPIWIWGQQGGSEIMRLNNTGLGIGTTSPAVKLDVNGSVRVYGGNLDLREPNQEDATNVIYFNANNGNATNDSNDIGTGIVWKPNYAGYSKRSAGIMQIGEGNYFKSGLAFYTNNTSNESTDWSERMRLDMDGNLGIGTSSPGSKFTVVGSNTGSVPLLDLTASGSGAWQRGVRLLNTGMSAGDSIMMAVGNRDNSKNMGQFYFYYAGNADNSNRISMGLHSVDDVFNILGTGNVGIGTTSPSANLQIGSPGANLTQDLLLVKGGGSSGNYGFRVRANNSDELFLVDTLSYNTIVSNGNLGIGTTSPGYKLDVSGGAIAIRGNAAGNSLRFDDTTATSRNAMYVDSSNYLNIGNSNYAGVKFVQTATAPNTGAFDGQSVQQAVGTTDNGTVLAEPDAWLAVRVGTTDYAIPMYTTG